MVIRAPAYTAAATGKRADKATISGDPPGQYRARIVGDFTLPDDHKTVNSGNPGNIPSPGPARLAQGFAFAVSAVFWLAVSSCIWAGAQ